MKVVSLNLIQLNDLLFSDECVNEASWCKAAKPDCSEEFVQTRCRKFCNLCDIGKHRIARTSIYKIKKIDIKVIKSCKIYIFIFLYLF